MKKQTDEFVHVTLWWAIITARHVFGRRILDRLLHLLSCEAVFILTFLDLLLHERKKEVPRVV